MTPILPVIRHATKGMSLAMASHIKVPKAKTSTLSWGGKDATLWVHWGNSPPKKGIYPLVNIQKAIENHHFE